MRSKRVLDISELIDGCKIFALGDETSAASDSRTLKYYSQVKELPYSEPAWYNNANENHW